MEKAQVDKQKVIFLVINRRQLPSNHFLILETAGLEKKFRWDSDKPFLKKLNPVLETGFTIFCLNFRKANRLPLPQKHFSLQQVLFQLVSHQQVR